MDAIHYAPYIGWVYPNETVIEWSVAIVVYPYITGLVAGAFTVSSLYQVFGFQRLKPVAHLALLTSLCFMIFVPTPLLLHLAQCRLRPIDLLLHKIDQRAALRDVGSPEGQPARQLLCRFICQIPSESQADFSRGLLIEQGSILLLQHLDLLSQLRILRLLATQHFMDVLHTTPSPECRFEGK